MPNLTNNPLWKGPEVDGVTQSMLGDFLVCRERFRVKYLEGLDVPDTFSAPLEYGNMWHVCEAAESDWETDLQSYVSVLCVRFPLEQENIDRWYQVCKIQFPVYLDYWKNYHNRNKVKPLLTEEVFKIPYKLWSGKTVFLRGKWDRVCTINKSVYLWENKTKGMVDEELLQRQLKFDLQLMFYMVALRNYGCLRKPRGALYNVVRRPLSGGEGSIRRRKEKVYRRKDGSISKAEPEETEEHFYNRLRDQVIAPNAEKYFYRWKIQITKLDIQRFECEFLIPILEQLYVWYQIMSKPGGQYRGIHYRYPYGVYNPLSSPMNGTTDLDGYLDTGNTVGLVRREQLFRELDDE